MDERRIRDVVRWEAGPKRIEGHLHNISEAITRTAEWIIVNHPRDERNKALVNLLVALTPYVEMYVHNLAGPIAVLALCTRSAFELTLRARFVIEKDGLNTWLTEATDEWVDVLDGFTGLAEQDDPGIQILEQDRKRVTDLKSKYQLTASRRAIKDLTMAQLASDFNLAQEYKSLYKLFSKIVHPTSVLVNGASLLDTPVMRNVLLTYFQIYALDCMTRIGNALGVPSDAMASRTASSSNGS